jgi:cysteinyl-tRNA synthetase
LNTPKAIAELHALHSKGDMASLNATLRALGFSQQPQSRRQVDAQKVNTLIDARLAARKGKNFKEADRIRDELNAMGIELEDKKDGTTVWKVKA